ncbi:type II toxin-antitoxin system YoeB family toxin [Sphingomonas sp.]|jgi:hypothetical protein|uniref:type II toxin-antitoxin system YoeB family toxin n=1 Tax=Sphingomonas sp. TaxID=28214 RepID=UPI002ED87B88
MLRHPFSGAGKPEPLGGNLSGWWSGRINQEHRLVYRWRGAARTTRCKWRSVGIIIEGAGTNEFGEFSNSHVILTVILCLF